MRGRERARGRFITQHRLQSGSARSLEVKDIPQKNVNGGKAAVAIPLQFIRTTEQELGRANQKVRKGREEQTEKVKLNAEEKSGRVTT